MDRPFRLATIVLLLGAAASAGAGDDRRFIFSYPFVADGDMAPRGGTTQGPAVVPDAEPHEGWLALREAGLTDFERDRRAILAMAGPYRSSFDFLEIAGFSPGFTPDKPYQSWGTEHVYVLEDTGRYISLQHVLVMFVADEEGEVQGPFVAKHWRQDWRYEDDELLVYRGHRTWERVPVAAAERAGTWSQAVYQVDDSPRYESYGRWQHADGFSTWKSERTWRPLPRREYSVRDDYDVLIGTNEHTITPGGWIQREENYKTVLSPEGEVVRHLALEYGVNRYRRIVDFDFSAGDQYVKATAPFWFAVRRSWREVIDSHRRFGLQREVDGAKLFEPMFRLAGEAAEADDPAGAIAEAQRIIDAFVVPGGSTAGSAGY